MLMSNSRKAKEESKRAKGKSLKKYTVKSAKRRALFFLFAQFRRRMAQDQTLRATIRTKDEAEMILEGHENNDENFV